MTRLSKICIWISVTLIMLCSTVAVTAVDANRYEEINISFPGEPSYVQNQSDAYFTVEIKIMGCGNRKYDICYSTDNFETSYNNEFDVIQGRYMKKRVSLAHIPKGAYDMSVRVMDGERVAAEKTIGMGIIEYYQPTLLDSFSKIGITTGMTQKGGYEIRHLASNQADLLKKCGISNIRYSSAGTWVSVEKLPGVYNFLGTNIYREYFNGMNNIQFVGGSRGIDLYKDPNGETAPRTIEQLDALMNFIKQKFNRYPIENSHQTIYSVWNEPNLQNYWPVIPSAYEYSVMQRMISLEAKERYPDMPVIALDIANGTDAIEYIKKMMDTDAYPYIEGYSFHPYSFPRDIDTSYEPLIAKFLDVEDEYGGWLDCYITETGYPTPKSTQGVSEEVQAENIVKALVYNDEYEIDATYFYSFKDNGPDETDRESNFGILDYDWSPKAGYAAMAQATKMLNSANYVGVTNIAENIKAYVYIREGKPLVIAWAPSDNVNFEVTDGLYVEDLYGNQIKEKSIVLSKSPVYIQGYDEQIMHNALAEKISGKLNTFVEEWDNIADLSEIKGMTNVETVKLELQKPEMFANKLFGVGDKLIENQFEGGYSTEQLGTMLDKLFKINRYVVLALKDGEFKVESTSAVGQAGAMIKNRKNGDTSASIKITDKIYTQAKKYNFRLKDLNNNSNAILHGYDLLSVKLCAWAEEMLKKESVNTNVKIITHSYPSYVNSFQDQTEVVKYTVINDRKTAIDGYVVITDEKGEEVSERYTVNLESGRRNSFELSFKIPIDKPAGDYTYRISLMENGKESSFLIFPVTVKTLFDVKLNSVNTDFEDMDTIELVVDCLYDGGATGVFEITPPEGWKFRDETIEVKFDNKEQKTIKLEVEEKAKARFNEYIVGVAIKKQDGEMILDKKIPIDFNLILQTDSDVAPADYDGSLKDWEDAYPIHIGAPQEPDNIESWESSNIAARAFLKWSPAYLYILADIYDDYHSNMFTGSGNWNGDNVQISIDSLCDKAASYQSDDYEIGFSYASAGNDIWEYYNSENVQRALNPDYMKVVRDNRYNITRYYIRLPLSEITPANLSINSKIGFNYGINDGDMIERERFIEYTLGTCTKKSPALYNDFLFIGSGDNDYKVDTGTYRVELQNDFTN